MAQFTDNQTPINAVTTTTTSGAIDISMREQVSAQFIASGIALGNGVFTMDASNDGTNWITGVAFQDATATASTTWVTSKTLSSNTTAGGFIPLAPWRFIRYKVTVTTDGTYTVVHQAQGS